MKRVNRWVVVVRPKSPFYDWANSLEDDHPPLRPKEFIGDATVLLIDEQGEHVEAEEYVVARFGRIFEHFLGLRVQDPLVWPTPRSLDMFSHWFDIEIHENTMDLGNERIRAKEV